MGTLVTTSVALKVRPAVHRKQVLPGMRGTCPGRPLELCPSSALAAGTLLMTVCSGTKSTGILLRDRTQSILPRGPGATGLWKSWPHLSVRLFPRVTQRDTLPGREETSVHPFGAPARSQYELVVGKEAACVTRKRVPTDRLKIPGDRAWGGKGCSGVGLEEGGLSPR